MNAQEMPRALRVGIFNAGHEEALSSGLSSFTASLAARCISRDLSLLPWWGFGCDAVAVSDVEACRRFLEESSLLPRSRRLVSSLAEVRGAELMPWGWDAAIAGEGRRAGLATASDGAIARVGELQSRRFSSAMLAPLIEQLRSEAALTGMRFTGQSAVATSMGQVESLAGKWGEVIVKKLISGSGRGKMKAGAEPDKRTAAWIESALRKDGAVEVQPLYARVADFALELTRYRSGECRISGFSEFRSYGGAYAGNFLSPLSREGGDVRRLLGCNREAWQRFAQCVAQEVGLRAKEYEGPIGVDMMVCREGEGLAVFPCVELNFRLTMGMVANSLGIMPDEGSTAWFRIASESSGERLKSRMAAVASRAPLVKSRAYAGDERYLLGYLPLTPIGSDTRFHAYMEFRYGGAFLPRIAQ